MLVIVLLGIGGFRLMKLETVFVLFMFVWCATLALCVGF